MNPVKKYVLPTVTALVLLAVFFSPLAVSAKAQPRLEGYHPLAEVYEEIKAIQRANPDMVTIHEIGESVEGRPIMALEIKKDDGVGRPEALITANIHASEVLSSRVALGVANRLSRDYDSDPWITSILDRTDVWIVPVVNPDGYYTAIAGGGKGIRKNSNGVDLNRNFPLAPGARSIHPLSGNRFKWSSYYMGPEQLSEPETRAIAGLVSEHDFYVSINGHTVAGKFLYPHGFTRKPAAHQDEFQEMGQAFVSKQPKWQYSVQISCSWYPTLGDMDDYLYMEHGIMSVTIEHGTVKHNLKYALRHPKWFWVANPHDPGPWVENDGGAILSAVEKALEITGGEPFDPAECHPVKR